MGKNVQKRGEKYQLRVTHKLLPKPYFYTFGEEQEAINYGDQLVSLLDRGIIPAELADQPGKASDPLFSEVAQNYDKAVGHAPSEGSVFEILVRAHRGLRISAITLVWTEQWIASMKLKEQLSPSTIRKRVGLMGRILDWHFRQVTPTDKTPPSNPLRLLPKNYSVANAQERRELERQGLKVKKDVIRNRRLTPQEEQRIADVFAGLKREDRERRHGSADDPMFQLLFYYILHTGVRLIEAVWQRKERIDISQKLIHVDGSKGWYGAIKPRHVPLVPALEPLLKPHLEGEGFLFPFWDGNESTRDQASRRLSQRFASLFDYAKIEDFTEHDLRHEATCRWVTMKNRSGQWMFSDIEICRIMGWTDTRLLLRYASLRGTDLAQRLSE